MNTEVRDPAADAAVIFMVNWMKRKGVDKEKLLDLNVWNEAEQQHIHKIYRYKY